MTEIVSNKFSAKELRSFSIGDLCRLLGLSFEGGKALGKPHLLNMALIQIGGEQAFGHITNCDDSRNMATSDAEADLARLLKSEGCE